MAVFHVPSMQAGKQSDSKGSNAPSKSKTHPGFVGTHRAALGRPSVEFAGIDVLPKIRLSHPEDPDERQADSIARKITSMPEGIDNNAIQQDCIACEGKGDHVEIHRMAAGNNEASANISEFDSSLQGGAPLEPSVRDFMESRFGGYDFGSVRIHTDERAAKSAQAINAAAYTLGNDIVFNRGQYNPNTNGGRQLLAHELAHHIQQGRSVASPQVVQREILTYNSTHTELHPTYGESMTTIWDEYSGESSAIRSALQALITAGKVGTSDDGSRNFFYNKSATRAEFSSAFTAAGYSNASTLTDAMMDNHNVYIYSGTRVTKSSTLFWESTLSTRTDVTERQRRRLLTDFEKNEARIVFGSNLNLNRIRVEEDPVMSVGGYARTTPWTINFPSGSFGGSGFMPWLIHELGHSWQYQHGYSLWTTLYHAIEADYDYGGEAGLNAAHSAGHGLSHFTTEEQAQIARDYYVRKKAGQDVTAWLPFINEFKGTP